MSRLSRLRRRGESSSDSNRPRLPPEFRYHSQDIRDRVFERREALLDRGRAVYLQATALQPQRLSALLRDSSPLIAEPVVRRKVRIRYVSPILRDWRNIRAGKYLFCVRRKVRREVMHALRIAGKRGIGRGGSRRTPESYFHCGG